MPRYFIILGVLALGLMLFMRTSVLLLAPLFPIVKVAIIVIVTALVFDRMLTRVLSLLGIGMYLCSWFLPKRFGTDWFVAAGFFFWVSSLILWYYYRFIAAKPVEPA